MKPIETERLLLRPWRLEDAADMYAYAKNPNVGPNAGWKPHESVEESKAILESWMHSGEEEDIWAIVPKETAGPAAPLASTRTAAAQVCPTAGSWATSWVRSSGAKAT